MGNNRISIGRTMSKTKRSLIAIDINRSIGARIREKRSLANMSLDEAADLSGISLSRLSRYEIGEHAIDGVSMVKLANAFGCDPMEFLVDFQAGKFPMALGADAIAVARMVNEIKSGGLRVVAKKWAASLVEFERNGDAR